MLLLGMTGWVINFRHHDAGVHFSRRGESWRLKTLGEWGITSLALTPRAVFTSSKGAGGKIPAPLHEALNYCDLGLIRNVGVIFYITTITFMFEKSLKQHSNNTHIRIQQAVRCNWFAATTFLQATVSPITMKLAVNASLSNSVQWKLFFLDI